VLEALPDCPQAMLIQQRPEAEPHFLAGRAQIHVEEVHVRQRLWRYASLTNIGFRALVGSLGPLAHKLELPDFRIRSGRFGAVHLK